MKNVTKFIDCMKFRVYSYKDKKFLCQKKYLDNKISKLYDGLAFIDNAFPYFMYHEQYSKEAETKLEVLDEDNFAIDLFTGLKDCKGREIYEGDIVKRYHRITDDEFLCEVVYRQSCCQFVLRVVETCIDVGKNEIFELSQSVARNCKVVGNIHENKELLK